MASDDEDQMRDLFGSDDEDGDADFGKGRLRQAGAGEDGMEEDAAAEEGLEDDLELGDADAGGPGRGGRQVAVSEEPEEEEAAAEGQRAERRRRPAPPGHRPLAKTAQAIDHAAPLLPVPPPINDVYLLREALISIEPVPFNPETYAGEDEIFTDEKGYTKVKPVDSTKIRWRYVRRKGADGREQMLPESNARFVRWSDGSLQLLLGEEVFDVDTADISAQHAYMVAYSGVVQGQAALTSKMGFRLATLNSKLYARMREEVDKRTMKVKRVGQHVEANDPSREKERRAKEAEDTLRNRAQLEARQQRTMARYAGTGARRGRPELNTGYLEEEDGLDGGAGGDDGFIDDGDGRGGGGFARRRFNEEEEEEAARRLQRAKGRAVPPGAGVAGSKRRRGREESEEEEEELPDDEDEEEEYVDSEGGSEDEEAEEEEEDEGDDGGKRNKPTPPPKPKSSAPPRANKSTPPPRGAPQAKVRRGVVLSDDEDE